MLFNKGNKAKKILSAVTLSQQNKQMENSRQCFSVCSVLDTLYGRKNSLLARRKLDRFPYLQYSTITISGPVDTNTSTVSFYHESTVGKKLPILQHTLNCIST